MSYTTPPTFSPSDVLAAADLDILSDDITYLKAQTDLAVLSGCLVGRTTNQAITNTTDTNVSWTTETFDQGGWIAVTSDTVTVPAGAIPPGYTTVALDLRFAVNFAANATGYRKATIQVTGTDIMTSALPGSASVITACAGSAIATAVAGDTIKLDVYQTSGGSLNVVSAFLFVGVFKPVS